MKNQKSEINISFSDLVKAVEQLSETDKVKVLELLNRSVSTVVNEPNAVYEKPKKLDTEFESKWNKAITTEDFTDKVHQHIESLPWR